MTAWRYTEADRDFVARHVEPFCRTKCLMPMPISFVMPITQRVSCQST